LRPLRLALPSEELLLGPTRELLAGAGVELRGYDSTTRRYRPGISGPVVGGPVPAAATMLRDRDIPIQVGVGNYDLGVCSLLWAEELLARYPSSGLVKLFDCGSGAQTVYAACWRERPSPSLAHLARRRPLRVVTEQPNLTERFVLEERLPRVALFPVWDRAEVYLPEHADLAVLSVAGVEELASLGLRPVAALLHSTAYVVAHAASLKGRDMSPLLQRLAELTGPSAGDSGGETTLAREGA